jgi:choline-sulfatase
VRNARHAYYGMITYIDDKVGRILDTLRRTQLDHDTVVIFAADHGEMIGERGMWFKQNFFEWSVRIPLLISHPRTLVHRRVRKHVSLLDLAPTLLEIASPDNPIEPADKFDGISMTELLQGRDNAWPDMVIAEYTDLGVAAPCRMVRKDRFKYMYTHGQEDQLYDLDKDPHELTNLAALETHAAVVGGLRELALNNWDPVEVNERVLASQRRRRMISHIAQQSGSYPNWAYVARPGDERRFVRGSGTNAGAVGTKRLARFPHISAPE